MNSCVALVLGIQRGHLPLSPNVGFTQFSVFLCSWVFCLGLVFFVVFFFLLRKKRAIFNEINVIHDLKKQKHFPEYEVENENHF